MSIRRSRTISRRNSEQTEVKQLFNFEGCTLLSWENLFTVQSKVTKCLALELLVVFIKYWPQQLPENLTWLIVEGTGSGGTGGQMVVVRLHVQAGKVMSAGAHLPFLTPILGGLSHFT